MQRPNRAVPLGTDLRRPALKGRDAARAATLQFFGTFSSLTFTVPAVEVPLVGLADLILMKLYAGGLQDRWDIQQLIADTGDGALLADVDGRVRELPERSQALWRTLRAAQG